MHLLHALMMSAPVTESYEQTKDLAGDLTWLAASRRAARMLRFLCLQLSGTPCC